MNPSSTPQKPAKSTGLSGRSPAGGLDTPARRTRGQIAEEIARSTSPYNRDPPNFVKKVNRALKYGQSGSPGPSQGSTDTPEELDDSISDPDPIATTEFSPTIKHNAEQAAKLFETRSNSVLDARLAGCFYFVSTEPLEKGSARSRREIMVSVARSLDLEKNWIGNNEYHTWYTAEVRPALLPFKPVPG